MASKAKAEARFRLSGPTYLLVPVFEPEIGPFGPVEALEKLVSYSKKKQKKRTFAP